MQISLNLFQHERNRSVQSIKTTITLRNRMCSSQQYKFRIQEGEGDNSTFPYSETYEFATPQQADEKMQELLNSFRSKSPNSIFSGLLSPVRQRVN